MPVTAPPRRRKRPLRSAAAVARRLARRVLVERLRLVPAGSDVRPYALPACAWVLERRWAWRLRTAPVMTLDAYAATVSPGETEEVVACPLCAGRLVQPLFEAERPGSWRYRAVRCADCGFLYRNPGIRPERLGDLYNQGDYSTFLSGRYSRQRREDYRRALDSFGPLFADGSGRRLLDYGCGVGLFLQVARERGFDAFGVDLAPDAVQEARRRGLAAWLGAPEDVPEIAAGDFDVVTLWSVLAHLPRPVADLSRLRGLLAHDGVLLVYTVNANSLLLKAYGPRWGGFTRNHLIFSSPTTLPALLRVAGYGAVILRPQYPRSVERGTAGLSARRQRRLRRAVERGNQGPMLRAAAFVRADGPTRWGLADPPHR
jgi:2-polyprenyl-3-methyl-5-hydroxy-6-metoxy-1,4-benzoquinol methylase